MRKIIAIASLCGAVFCAYKSNSSSSPVSIYKIEYSGKPGAKILGLYTLLDTQGRSPNRLKKIEAILPHQLSLNVPADHQVMAGAVLLTGDKESVTTTIFKNGVECSYPSLIEAKTMNMVTCEP